MENEKETARERFDRYVVPVIEALYDLIKKNGMSLVCVVEFERGTASVSVALHKDSAGDISILTALAAQSGGNFEKMTKEVEMVESLEKLVDLQKELEDASPQNDDNSDISFDQLGIAGVSQELKSALAMLKRVSEEIGVDLNDLDDPDDSQV